MGKKVFRFIKRVYRQSIGCEQILHRSKDGWIIVDQTDFSRLVGWVHAAWLLVVAARCGQAKEKASSAVRRVFRTDRAAMSFNNGANDGQPHAHSGLFGGKEMIENFFRPILRQPGAEIANTDLGALSLDRTGTDNDTTFDGGSISDSVECVHDEVEQDLLDLNRRSLPLAADCDPFQW